MLLPARRPRPGLLYSHGLARLLKTDKHGVYACEHRSRVYQVCSTLAGEERAPQYMREVPNLGGAVQDMTQPLAAYFISSSHNTYLTVSLQKAEAWGLPGASALRFTLLAAHPVNSMAGGPALQPVGCKCLHPVPADGLPLCGECGQAQAARYFKREVGAGLDNVSRFCGFVV
jgi:hypothetical protein